MEINISDLIFAAINFLIMIGVLTFLLYKPVIKILDDRRKKIEAENSEASILLSDAKIMKESCQQEIIEARQEAARLLQEAARDGEAKKQSMLEEAKKASELTYKNIQSDLKLEREKMEIELKEEVVALAAHIARKIMTSSVTISSSNRIEEFVLQISKPETLKQISDKIAELGYKAFVEIVTYKPLSDYERSLINKLLDDAGASNAMLLESISDELVGGCILFVGDLMFDASVSNKLKNIGKELLID